MYEPRSAPVAPFEKFTRRLVRHFGFVLGLVAGSLLLGMAGYMWLGRMSAVDAFLNSAMLLGGMGPVGDLPSSSAKIFAGVFALYAGLVFIVSASILIAPIAHRILHRIHAEDGPRKTKGAKSRDV